MRELKFRAWDKEYKKMLYQDQFKCNNKLMKYHNQIKWFFWHLYNIPIGHKGYSDPMEYTNLKDKHGKEIYEGDIVKFDVWNLEVKINEFKGVYGEYWITTGKSFSIDENGEYIYDKQSEEVGAQDFYFDCEIIGNIYENPELLENK